MTQEKHKLNSFKEGGIFPSEVPPQIFYKEIKMKEKSAFIAALNSKDGKTHFVMMLVFIGMTIVISSVFKNQAWSFVGSFITCCLSITEGTAFCRELMKFQLDNKKK